MPFELASSQTVPATLALWAVGFATTLVTDAWSATGSWTEVSDAVFVTEVCPVGNGLFTVTLKVVTML